MLVAAINPQNNSYMIYSLSDGEVLEYGIEETQEIIKQKVRSFFIKNGRSFEDETRRTW